jgi:hypothetical protein
MPDEFPLANGPIEPQYESTLPRFGLRSLLDLFETRISVADPITRLIDLRWIYGNRARNFFASRH